MYRTGDVARFQAPGRLSVTGRADDQVKVRGHRVEPGDVEAAIADHVDVARAVVSSRDGRLVAYCVREARTATPARAEAAKVAALDRMLRPWLAQRLPPYMVTSFFVELDALPVTASGKVDRKAPPDPVEAMPTSPAPDAVSGLEARILATWAAVLGHDRAGVQDNFFEVGGDSARVLRVQKRLERLLGKPVSAATLFEHYTARSLAKHLGDTPAKDGTRRAVAARGSAAMEDQDIAIVSMACRLPGGVATPRDFWALLEQDGDAIVDVPADRWEADDLDDDADQAYCRRGGFIDSVDSFDTPFFGVSPREARAMDPTQCLMLETCWEAFERAGYNGDEL